ncbi:hypothetical protein CWB99_05630 [Pseudoalteromonas rubra]|uniref:Carrier domain-containing protein n=1 Tax=Pseudoalteromonas rubra TaxID=43658 RepID=A0A5S3X1H0_9GAMM|nr:MULTISPECIES: phosphopantetheine-binding protein [Pseudoalteromonas]AZZ96245.1 hypothetical protein ELR70_03345 [Pseudoalteromonas sp. R3]MCO7190815.1 phosphopantetheine-binding protein [Pseudoalteromonas sp. XMcav2-N]TMP30814.1 hypothetical protein CWB99_05630 [Pseudoalteromonas rubra]TMP34182.1 hypothetical protein CWC00_08460 [Pseudoalteromonas rubra]TMP37360.1 hypothetical protein CWB98_11570 [Pseudoalteromonas rubra]
MADFDQIRTFIKQDIIVDNLEVVDSIDELDDEQGLVSDGLELDSIEVLELVVSIEKKYGMKFSNYGNEVIKEKMASINALAQFVSEEARA